MAEEATEGIATEPQEGIADDPAEEGGIADSPAGEEGLQGGTESATGDKRPEEYELTAPEDFPVPEENLKSFTQAARKLGLTKKQAEGMLGWHREFHTAATGEMRAQQQATLQGWAREIQADHDFGGKNWKNTLSEARRALDAFDADGSLRALLRESGYQNNPCIIRAVARVGRAMGEHGLVTADGGKGRSVPLEERMYPNM